MGRAGTLLTILVIVGNSVGCDPSKFESVSKIPPIPEGACYEFVDFKIEDGKWKNEMFLYALHGPLKYEEFKALCLDIKSRARNEAFTYVVLFDKRENAAFPTNPFTAMYGGDDELAEHIKAIYGMCTFNKFSELRTYYPKNMMTGIPKREQL